jgi:hypothetical protein
MSDKDKTNSNLINELTELKKGFHYLKILKDSKSKKCIELTKELVNAYKEIAILHEEKGKRAAELIIANLELDFQNEEKKKRAAELVIANIEQDD